MSLSLLMARQSKNTDLSAATGESGDYDFADWLAEMMQLRGMDQVQLAEKSGVDQTTISKHLRRKLTGIRAATIRQLAEALDVSPDRGLTLAGYSTADERERVEHTLPNGGTYIPPASERNKDVLESLLNAAMLISRERKEKGE